MSPVRVMLIEPRPSSALAALRARRPLALMPIANRPLIDLNLAALAAAGCVDVEVRVHDRADAVAAHVSAGHRWGFPVRVVECASPSWEVVEGALEDGTDAPDLLVLPLDIALLEAAPIADVLRQLPHCNVRLNLRPDDPGAGMVMRVLPAGVRSRWADIALSGAVRIADPRSYWEANLHKLSRLGGTLHPERRYGAAAYVAPDVVIDEGVELSDPLVIGAGSRIHAHARVGGNAVVGSRVFVGARTDLAETVVLGETVIGPALRLRRRIIDGNIVVDVDTGAVSEIADPKILTALPGAGARRHERRRVFSRWAAALTG